MPLKIIQLKNKLNAIEVLKITSSKWQLGLSREITFISLVIAIRYYNLKYYKIIHFFYYIFFFLNNIITNKKPRTNNILMYKIFFTMNLHL